MTGRKDLTGRKRVTIFVAGLLLCVAFAFQIVGAVLRAYEPADTSTSHTHGHSFFHHPSSPLPLFPGPNPPEPPTQSEVEATDECDDELSSLFANLRANDNDLLFAKKQLLLHLRVSIDNRSSVSLVVLYHCWKSLLA